MEKQTRTPGRPKAHKGLKKSEQLRVPITITMRRQLAKKVPAGQLSAYVRALIERDLAT